eukprot:757514-Hanusia_phi.AAC.4
MPSRSSCLVWALQSCSILLSTSAFVNNPLNSVKLRRTALSHSLNHLSPSCERPGCRRCSIKSAPHMVSVASSKAAVAPGTSPTKKSVGTDPSKLMLDPYTMFPAAENPVTLDWNETSHSGGDALLQLYHGSSRVVIVEYWYKKCAMCKVMQPLVQRVVREYDGKIHFVEVEVFENQKVVQHAGLRSVPAFQVFYDGKMIDHFSGLHTVKAMRAIFSNALEMSMERLDNFSHAELRS